MRAPGSWFPPSPCPADAPPFTLQAGAQLLLSVHYQPDTAPHDVVVTLGPDHLWRVAAEEWLQWTPVAPQVEHDPGGRRWVTLRSGPALALRLDACTAELWVDADPRRHHEVDLSRPASRPVARAGYGGFLNLDFAYGGLAGRNVVDSVLDLGAFGPQGAGRSDFFVGSNAVRRLDTYWVHDEPDSAVRLRLGDSITHAADWETPVRLRRPAMGHRFHPAARPHHVSAAHDQRQRGAGLHGATLRERCAAVAAAAAAGPVPFRQRSDDHRRRRPERRDPRQPRPASKR